MKDDDVKYLRDKLDKLTDGLAQTNTILERNTASLEEHMRRTNILESKVLPIESKIKGAEFLVKTLLAAVPVVALAHALGWL